MIAGMKTGFTLMALAVLAALPASRIVVAEKSPAEVAFERLKSLAGTWETVDKETKRTGVATYTVTGGGKVVLEVMGGMATAYHFDKGTLMMTHYCGAGNQPRMKAKSIDSDGPRLYFEMFDITNHANPASYYTGALDLRFAEDGTAELAFKGMTDGAGSTQTLRLVKRVNSSATP